MQKSGSVNDPEVAAHLLFGETFPFHCRTQSIGNAYAGGTCSSMTIC